MIKLKDKEEKDYTDITGLATKLCQDDTKCTHYQYTFMYEMVITNFIQDEITSYIKKLKLDKSPRRDNIINEISKDISESIIKPVSLLFNKILD